MITIMSNFLDSLFHKSESRPLSVGETLFRTHDTVTDVFQVTSGAIVLRRVTIDGAELTLQDAQKGDVLAEASLYSPAYHCDAVARQNATIRSAPVTAVLARLRSSADLAELWAAHLAQSVQMARTRSEIRTLKTVSARFDAWLDLGGQPPSKGKIQEVAAEIGVSREALYRELAKRKPKNWPK